VRDDHESTTTILKRLAPGVSWLPRAVRERLTPAALWSALSAVVVAVVVVANAERDISRLKENVTALENQRELLVQINTQLAVMSDKVSNIDSEVQQQRAWRERIEEQAEVPIKRRR
jgi:hypothetical protein